MPPREEVTPREDTHTVAIQRVPDASGPVVGNLTRVLPPSSMFLDLVLWLIRMIKLLNQFMALHPLAIQFPWEQLHEAEFYLKGRLTFGVQITVSSGNCSCVLGPVSP